jgi:methylenetetrahydrofolate dehydrogenase (NADP+) / methenyltetrahydrofolate cyclohydrolase
MILDGKIIAQQIESHIAQAISGLAKKPSFRPPGLAFILVGEDPASKAFIKMKKKRCKEVGILSWDREFSDQISEKALLEEIRNLNQNDQVDGILIQLPLPPTISPFKVMETINPQKDVDGFHPLNMGKLLLGENDGFFPCTPYGIVILLNRFALPVEGKHVVIVGRSNIVGKPLAALLMQKRKDANATVTVAHSHTESLQRLCREADVLIAAIGKPHFIKKEMVKEGAIVIDVGINRLDRHIVGDVDFESVAPLCKAISPVPGGVGPMTIAMLLSNTFLSYQRHLEKVLNN